MPGPLDGVRILEFTEIIAGPFGGMMLADMGADVIKIEPPWGEPWRHASEFLPDESKTYISLNRGKRSLPLDLTKPEGREVVYKLIANMDAVIVNARPDVPYNLGIDYETLSSKNPRLIYCENTAFGRKGPHSYRPGYDIIAQAMTGLMTSESKIRNGVPQQIQATAVADFSTGIAIAWGICAALYHRERTGEGQKIESTLLGSAMALQTSRFLQVAMIDDGPRAELIETINILRESGAPHEEIQRIYDQHRVSGLRVGNIYYRTYQAKDGTFAVGCLSDPLRIRFAKLLGLNDIRFEPGYDPASERARIFGEELTKRAEAIVAEKTVDEWLKLLDEARIPAGPIRFAEELIDDEQVKANDMMVSLEHSTAGRLQMVGPMLKMSQTPLSARSASPTLGEHTVEILADLEYSPEQIQHLKDSGITR